MTYTSIAEFTRTLSRSFLRAVTFIFIIFAISSVNDLKAAESKSAEIQTPGTAPITILEGKAFSGELGPPGKAASATDLLLFNDGMFVSKGCEARCGYTAAEYQIRAKGDQFEVTSETPCLKSDAIIVWRGTVTGNEIEGTFTWVNKRWYWTFEKEFWFKGKLVDANAAAIEAQ